MPALQTTYSETMRPAVAGMIADMTPQEIVSRVVEEAAGLGFGVICAQGTGAGQVRAMGAGRKVIGVTVMDPTIVHGTPQATPDFYPDKDVAAVMLRGTIWVVAGGTIAAGDRAAVLDATGAFVVAGTASSTAIFNGQFETGGAASALVKLRLI